MTPAFSKLTCCVYLPPYRTVGIGYLLVFLVIQPEAWAELRGMLGCACACAFCCKGKRRKKRRKKRKGVQQPVGNREHEAEDLYVERCHAESSLYSGSNSDSHHSHLQHSGSHSHSSSARCQVEARIGRTIAPDEEDSVSEEGNGEGDSCSEGSSEDEIDTTPRDSSYTVSSSDSSMFPLLDNMTEVCLVTLCCTHVSLFPHHYICIFMHHCAFMSLLINLITSISSSG